MKANECFSVTPLKFENNASGHREAPVGNHWNIPLCFSIMLLEQNVALLAQKAMYDDSNVCLS